MYELISLFDPSIPLKTGTYNECRDYAVEHYGMSGALLTSIIKTKPNK